MDTFEKNNMTVSTRSDCAANFHRLKAKVQDLPRQMQMRQITVLLRQTALDRHRLRRAVDEEHERITHCSTEELDRYHNINLLSRLRGIERSLQRCEVEATHLITIEETQVIELVDLWLCAPPQTSSSDPADDHTNSLSMGLDHSSFDVATSTRPSACANPDRDASAADTVPSVTPNDKA
jgi:hypothetical protein